MSADDFWREAQRAFGGKPDHRLFLPDGTRVPGVTTITGFVDDGKADRLASAAAWITRCGRNYADEWEYKRDRGVRVHERAERLFSGAEDFDVFEDELPYLDALERAISEHDLWEGDSEFVVLSATHRYGARGDRRTPRSIVDFKSGHEDPVPHALQLFATNGADGDRVCDERGRTVAIEPFAPREELATCYLRKDGTYRWVAWTEHVDQESGFAAFLDVARARESYEALKKRLPKKGK